MEARSSGIFRFRQKIAILIGMTILLISFGSCGPVGNSQPTIAPTRQPRTEIPLPTSNQASTPTLHIQREISPETSPESPGKESNDLNVPIGVGVWDASHVEIFNRYADEQDLIAFRSQVIDLLKNVKVGQKMLVLGPNDEPLDQFSSLVSEAKQQGVTILGYNLEKALPIEELVRKEKEIQSLAKNEDLLYVFGPTLLKLTKNVNDFAQNTDVILLQSQILQTSVNFEEQVEELVSKIKSSNPKVKVWVQVSVNPPENRDIATEEVIQQIESIADQADLVWIFFAPNKSSALEAVLKGLRLPGGIPNGLTVQTPTPAQTSPNLNDTQLVSTHSNLVGYWTFTRPSELPLSDLNTYTNVIFYPQDSENDYPNDEDLQALRENNLKIVVKLDKRIVEETFDQTVLTKLKTRLDRYRDVVYAIWPIDEPYKENRWKLYTPDQLQALVHKVKGIFLDYKIWVNFLTPTDIAHQAGGYHPNIPSNIDIVSIDIYLHSGQIKESDYKKFIGDNLTLIGEKVGGRPVLFASRSFSMVGEKGTPLIPDQVNWDADLVEQYGLLGLAWYYYDDSSPYGQAHGASHFPEIIAKQKEAGVRLLSETDSAVEASTNYPSATIQQTKTATMPQATPAPGETVRHPLVIAIEQQTDEKYPLEKVQIESAVSFVNRLLAYAGVRREFFIDRFAPVYDRNQGTNCKARESAAGYLPDEYCHHPGNEVFVVVDETSSKNYPFREGPSVEWHGLKEDQASQKDSLHYLFIPDSLHVFAHELGHILGLPDLYLLRVAGKDNHVNGQAFPDEAYHPFEDDIMYGGTFGIFSAWDKEIIDRENPIFPARYNSWFDYQPKNTTLQILDQDGKPLPLVGVEVYSHARTPQHKQVIDSVPEYSGQTDAAGYFSLGADILGLDRNDSVKVFLAEISVYEQVDYRWFSFMDVNFAFWRNEALPIRTNITNPPGAGLEGEER